MTGSIQSRSSRPRIWQGAGAASRFPGRASFARSCPARCNPWIDYLPDRRDASARRARPERDLDALLVWGRVTIFEGCLRAPRIRAAPSAGTAASPRGLGRRRRRWIRAPRSRRRRRHRGARRRLAAPWLRLLETVRVGGTSCVAWDVGGVEERASLSFAGVAERPDALAVGGGDRALKRVGNSVLSGDRFDEPDCLLHGRPLGRGRRRPARRRDSPVPCVAAFATR
jgi:hypothetical protein